MKAVFTILFSLLLIAGQAAFPAVPSMDAGKSSCACSTCAKNCCARPETPATPVQPVAPVSASGTGSWQLIITQALSFLEMPAAKPAPLPVEFSASPKTTAVPLYEWNCSYVI